MKKGEEGSWRRDCYDEINHVNWKPYNELLFDSGYRPPVRKREVKQLTQEEINKAEFIAKRNMIETAKRINKLRDNYLKEIDSYIEFKERTDRESTKIYCDKEIARYRRLIDELL